MTPLDKDWPPEIDIVEMLGDQPQTLHFTNHYGTPETHQMKNTQYNGVDFSLDYHVYAVEWEPGIIRWYVDSIKRFESTSGVPNEPFILRMSLPVGPDWEGDPTDNSVFPLSMKVDWVRVYQRI
jgi:beta-glucanase (GH16 family)